MKPVIGLTVAIDKGIFSSHSSSPPIRISILLKGYREVPHIFQHPHFTST